MIPEPPSTSASDPARPPGPLARALTACVRAYQAVLSPALHALAGPGCGCRFTPTCSHYAIEALALHGAARGTLLATKRVLRCHPWGAHGADPVPARRLEKPFSADNSFLHG